MTTFTATYSPDDNKLRLSASQRLDAETYTRVKAAGFAWAPKQDQFIAPMWTPARADLCIELAGQIADDDSSLIERAEDRAERFDGYQEKRAAESESALAYVHRITEGIPLGQPILVGHHSERHARKDAERIENGMRRAVQLFDTAEYWKRRAAAAIRHASYKERADVRHRRIKGIEADARKMQKSIDERAAALASWEKLPGMVGTAKKEDGTPATLYDLALYVSGRESGCSSRCYPLADFPRDPPASQYEGPMSLYSALSGHVITGEQAHAQALRMYRPSSYAARWMEHYANRLVYERAMLDESGGIVADKFDLQPGGIITHRGRRSVILRVNRKGGAALSVSVTGQGWTVGVEEVTSYEPPTETASAAVASAVKVKPLCNYDGGASFARMTEAEYKALFEGSRVIRPVKATETHEAHRVRYIIGYLSAKHGGPVLAGYDIAPVFLTNAKIKPAPLKGEDPATPKCKSIARKIAEAAGIDTSATPETPTEPAPTLREILAAAPTVADVCRETARLESLNESVAERKTAAAPFDAMRQALRAGVQVVSAPQLFPTPPELAARMVALADIEPGARVLEPSAGTGRILDALRTAGHVDNVDAVEINRSLADGLKSRHPGAAVKCVDFLNIAPTAGQVDHRDIYSAVLMNPPFSNGDDIKHIQHAMNFLAPGGVLVAICANGPRQAAALRPMIEEAGGMWEPLPPGTFAESGTGVNVALLRFQRPAVQVLAA